MFYPVCIYRYIFRIFFLVSSFSKSSNLCNLAGRLPLILSDEKEQGLFPSEIFRLTDPTIGSDKCVHTICFIGSEKIERALCNKIKLSSASRNVETCFIKKKLSYLLNAHYQSCFYAVSMNNLRNCAFDEGKNKVQSTESKA